MINCNLHWHGAWHSVATPTDNCRRSDVILPAALQLQPDQPGAHCLTSFLMLVRRKHSNQTAQKTAARAAAIGTRQGMHRSDRVTVRACLPRASASSRGLFSRINACQIRKLLAARANWAGGVRRSDRPTERACSAQSSSSSSRRWVICGRGAQRRLA